MLAIQVNPNCEEAVKVKKWYEYKFCSHVSMNFFFISINIECIQLLQTKLLQDNIKKENSKNIEATILKSKMDLTKHIELKRIIDHQHSLKEVNLSAY